MALTAMQEKFKNEYILLLLQDKPNATLAAKKAGYSDKTAYSQGQRLLKNVEITAAIDKALSKMASKFEITAENVLQDIIDTRDSVATMMADMDHLKPSDVAALANARKANNELLGKHLKLFTDKVELAVTEMPEIKLSK